MYKELAQREPGHFDEHVVIWIFETTDTL